MNSTIRLGLLAAVTLGGCVARSSAGYYVREVHADGDHLSIQRCEIVLIGDSLDYGDCRTTDVALPSRYQGPPGAAGGSGPPSPLPATLTGEQIARGINGVRDQLEACRLQYRLPSSILLRITIDAGGRVTDEVATGVPAAAGACIGEALRGARFAPSQRGARAEIPIRAVP